MPKKAKDFVSQKRRCGKMMLWNKPGMSGGRAEIKTCWDSGSFVWYLLGNRDFSRVDKENLLLYDCDRFSLASFSSSWEFVIKTMHLGEEIR